MILYIGGGFNSAEGGIQRYNNGMISLLQKFEKNPDVISANDDNVQIGSVTVHGCRKRKMFFLIKSVQRMFFAGTVILGHRNFLILAVMKVIFPFKKFVMIAHGIEIWYKQPLHIRLLSKLLDQVWAVSHFTLKKFQTEFNNKTIGLIIPNMLPVSFVKIYSDAVIQKHKSLKTISLLSVCRLVKSENYKGVDLTLHALSKLEPKADFVYHIVAKGDDVERHKELVEKLGLNSKVRFYENLSDHELISLYQHCQVFILPSWGEGFGIVYLEAMANGLLCIGADYAGAADVIQNGKTGFLVPFPVDAEQLAEVISIKAFSENIRTETALAALESLSRFSIEAVQKKVESALSDLKAAV